MTVHPFIEAENSAGHSVKRACELLKVSRAAYYHRRTAAPGPRAVRDAELTEQITAAHRASRGSYGAPRVHAVLVRDGARVGRRRVARLMRQAGLQGRHRRRGHRTTVPDPHAATRPDLIGRDFAPGPATGSARWCGDITYLATGEGWLFLATVIDFATRKVVGWATADHLRTSLVADALRDAVRRQRPQPGTIFHADRGCQYTSYELALLAAGFGIRLSVGRTGICWDNAVAESFFATLKSDLDTSRPWPSRAAAHRDVFEYIEGWYNNRRLHSSLGYRTPVEYEAALAA
ncbi:IS3 family transposase [Yinghuangia soli]|uniref:IS3 family transposase n=1 Tax=Yinghuangia soli TaxID=2908204 RepID=A0AA41Q4R4_9ACTN|nr:IS3 family transposase [Yinghuangia soli]MCF2531172.1 IS3 family transposase [Yinghuangia soli]